MGDKLTPKQQRFTEEYLVDLNATQAAIRAGYSQKHAQQMGYENLSKPFIADCVAVAMKERQDRTQVTADMVVAELAKIGFSDLRNVLTSSGQLIDPQDWDDKTAGAIASLEVITNARGGNGDENAPIEFVHKIKAWDKNAALEKLAKHLGLYAPERHEHTGKDGKPLLVDPSQKLAELLSGIAKRSGKTS